MMTTLASLPVELHYEILSHLSHHDQILASMANPFWKAILSQHQRFRNERYSAPLGRRNGQVHSLIERADSRILCTMRMGPRDEGKEIEEFGFYYIFTRKDGRVVKYDVSTCPFLDEPWYIPSTDSTASGEGYGVQKGGKSEKKELQLRVGAVVCEPLWRGFFWVGEEFLWEPEMTVREMVEERISGNLKEEIKSSPLLKALAQGIHPVQFRPVVRLLEKPRPGMGGRAVPRQETFMDGQFLFDTRRSPQRRQLPSRRRPGDMTMLF
ncbi:hypothetical protein Dda_8224 [Drechslerella dactyloides]|uniref:F-box domain-containing protein n=1 Tax=Drechslerella dactyloides TaxID=74499 RepID=A0AAD6NGE4_DREDA|nr:hypothetical protein Dda_8224 [Drechslerella dactyloides]